VYSRHTECTAGLSCYRIIMEHIHDEYCDAFSTLGACNSPAGTAARKYALRYLSRRHLDANIYDINTQRMSCFYTTFWGQTKQCFTLEGVFNVYNSHPWTRDNPLAIRERGYQVCFSVSVWAGIIRGIVVDIYLLPEGWMLKDIVISLKLFYLGCLKACL
jgi:hypothetical protein